MGDFNYYDPTILRAAGHAIRDEAGKWEKMSSEMKDIAASTKELWLTPVSFAVADAWAGPPVSIDQFSIYQDVHKLLCGLFDGATIEFKQIGDALRRMATEYEKSDENSYINLSKIYSAN